MGSSDLENSIEEEAFQKIAPIQKARKAIAGSPTSWPEPLRDGIGSSLRWIAANIPYQSFPPDQFFSIPMAVPTPRPFAGLLKIKRQNENPLPYNFGLDQGAEIIEHKASNGIALVRDDLDLAIALPKGFQEKTATAHRQLATTLIEVSKNITNADLGVPTLLKHKSGFSVAACFKAWVLPLVLDKTDGQAKIIVQFQVADISNNHREVNYTLLSDDDYEMVGNYIRSIEHHFPSKTPTVPCRNLYLFLLVSNGNFSFWSGTNMGHET